MPEKEKGFATKSLSLQDICEQRCDNEFNDLNCDNGEAEHEQVDETNASVKEKTKTLPSGHTKYSHFYFLNRSNQLKRPLIIPKISFSSNKTKKDKRIGKVTETEMLDSIDHENDVIINQTDMSAETDHQQQQSSTKPIKKIVKTDSMKNFFVKVVNQISVSSRQRSKDAAQSEERSKEWRMYFDNPSKVPGVIGIRNHGNTCFINSILQCLSYTDILAEYFVLDQYKNDLK